MKISRFITLILVGALLIVGAVDLGRPDDRRNGERSVSDRNDAPDHYFIAADADRDGRIDCPMTETPAFSDIWRRDLSRCWLVDGWSPPADWGSWATGRRSQAIVEVATAGPRSLEIRTRANRDLPPDRPQAVTLLVNGRDLGTLDVRSTWTSLRFEIPAGVLQIGPNTLDLVYADRISPLEAGQGDDFRTLAAGVSELALLPLEGPDEGTAGDASPVEIWDAGRRAFLVDRPGVLVMPVFIPAGTSALRVDLQPSLSVDPATLRTVISAESLDGGGRTRVEPAVGSARKAVTAEIGVADLAGGWSLVSVEATLTAGALEISAPRLVHPAGPPVPAAADQAAQPGSRPDIVLITLDAARADHFSFAGYDRLTTPFIDSLAGESLVFRNAYALAPYTLCSVPTMITGLSFLDHGVTRHEDVLSPDAVTLAESLRAAGYQTACFSATPNNSRAKGFDQGYENFFEMWTEGPRKKTRRAPYIARRVAEWLDANADDGRPLHLQVHMVPPHAPYDPSPPNNLFTNPGYDGPCDGFRRTLAALDGGSMAPTPECLDHLLDLYDGNLREADAATRTIVDALKRRPRWRDTVLLVTSDHGEAFMEHGRTDHNSTLYGEMLHVPFVLRLPPGRTPPGIDTDRLVTLADIVPTLRGATGVGGIGTADGVDILAPAAGSASRFAVTRTATFPPVRGIRTLRWSLMVDAGGSGALFDLTADAGERRNVSLELPARYAGLGKILARELDRSPQLATDAGSADITDDERALLETLGYLR